MNTLLTFSAARRALYRVARVLAALAAAPLFGAAPAVAGDGWSTEPGLHKEKLELTGLIGQRRKLYYYVPEDLPADASVPLVVALHGGISSPKNIRRRSMLNELADREKLIAVYPQGNGFLNFLLHWNAGKCCGKAVDRGVDDVAFVMETIDRLSELLPVDRSRVYVFGFSNGAMLTYALAAAHPDRFAAIAGVSGTLGWVNDNGTIDWQLEPPPAGMPTLMIHGGADPRLPWEGAMEPGSELRGIGRVPVPEGARFWARANGCEVEQDAESGFANVEQIRWSQCRSGKPVELYRLGGWGHRWAGSSRHTKADHSTIGGFESIEVIWDFFRVHHTGKAYAAGR